MEPAKAPLTAYLQGVADCIRIIEAARKIIDPTAGAKSLEIHNTITALSLAMQELQLEVTNAIPRQPPV